MGTHNQAVPGAAKGSEGEKNGQEQTLQPLLLTISQAASYLGLSRAKLYALIAQGDGPPVVRFGRSVRISIASLNTWVRHREEQQNAEKGQKYRGFEEGPGDLSRITS
jgi:excisionase family DNA binding protein